MKDSMTSLENYLSQELQELREIMMNRLQVLEDVQSDTSESDIQAYRQQVRTVFPTPLKCHKDLPNVAMSSPMVFPVSVTEIPTKERHSHCLSMGTYTDEVLKGNQGGHFFCMVFILPMSESS